MNKISILEGEGKTLEYKVSLPAGDQLAKTACAFANRAGGQIMIGIDDHGQVVGIPDDEVPDWVDRIVNSIHDQVTPMILPEISTDTWQNRTILAIKIYPGNATPYYLKSKGKMLGTYIRVAATNKLADTEMIQSLERNRINLSYDEDIAHEADQETINRLIELLGKRLPKPVDPEKLVNLKMLIRKGEILYLTNGALIILGDCANCVLDCARFQNESMAEFIDRKEYRGNLFDQVQNGIQFIRNHIHLRGRFEPGSLQRKDELEIPEIVLREGILNAMLHRDYAIQGSTVKIAVYDSRIEIISPGGLPKTLTLEDMLSGRSEIRNIVLARIFKEAALIELWGSGIPRIMEACRKAGLRDPALSEAGLFLSLTVYRQSAGPALNLHDSQLSSQLAFSMPQRQNLLDLIAGNPQITVREIARILDQPVSTTARWLARLVDAGQVRRVGTNRRGYWEIS